MLGNGPSNYDNPRWEGSHLLLISGNRWKLNKMNVLTFR